MTVLTQTVEIAAKDRTKAAFDSAKTRMQSLGSAAISLKGAFVALASVGFGSAVSRSLEFGDRLQKLRIRLGTSTEFLSQFAFVLERSGIAFDQGAIALQRMTRRLSDASIGSGEAADALGELGIDAAALVRLPLETQFLTIAEALSKVESSSRKASLAQKIFDSEGVALLQTMEQGAAGIISLQQEADRLGKTLDDVGADSLANANDAVTNFRTVIGGLFQDLAVRISPGLQTMANILAGVVIPAIDAARAAVTGLMTVLGGLADAVGRVIQGDFSGALDSVTGALMEAQDIMRSGFTDAIEDGARRMGFLKSETDSVAKSAEDAARNIRDSLGNPIDRAGETAGEGVIKAAEQLIRAFDTGDKGGASEPVTQSFDLSRLVSPSLRNQDRQTQFLGQIKELLERIEKQRALASVTEALTA